VASGLPEGGLTRYAYDGHHGVANTAELTATSPTPLWRGTIASYDAYGERIATTDGRGVAVDANGHATLADPGGLYTRHAGYDTQGDLTSESTPPLTTTLNGITTTAPVTTSYTYDGDGNRQTLASANGGTTTYAYDHLGRRVTTTEPSVRLYDGTTTSPIETTGYDKDGNAVSTTDANGAVTTSGYDPLGREVNTTNPVSGTTVITYNATEQTATRDAQGNVTSRSYDAAGRLTQATDAVTGTVQYGYDPVGNTAAITSGDTLGNVTQVETRAYDALNRAITDTVTGPGGTPQATATYYDKDGNVYQTVQPTGAASVNTYDLADQLVTSESDPAPVVAATHQTQTVYRYDAAGNQVETIDPDGRDTTTVYDGANRTVQSVSVAPGVIGTTTLTTTAQYDRDGNTLAQTVQTRDPAGAVQTFIDTSTYDAADRATSATDNGLTTGYGYDAAGQQRTETIGNGASTVTRTLDPQGRETGLSEGGYATAFGYNTNDLITAITLPGGVSESAQYDANSRLTVWHDPGPGQNVTYAYGYDAASRVTAFTAVSGTDTLAYDAQNRLTSDCGPQVEARSPDHCYHWTYDATGNITTATTDLGPPITYTYTIPGQPNELAQTYAPGYLNPSTYFGYDGSGNTTAITSPITGSLTAPGAINTHIGYDAASRPSKVTLRDGRTVTMSYNAAGERASYSVITGTTTTLYSVQYAYRDGELGQATVYSATATGSVQYTDSYVYGQSGLPDHFDRQQNGTTSRYWYETDGRGDVVAVTDVNGNVVDSYEYDLWGEPLSYTTHEQVPQRIRYRSMWYDSEEEWLWDGSRSYDPELDRYLQPDSPDTRSYVYAGDDPVGAGRGTGDVGGFSTGVGVIGATPSFEGNVECGVRPGVGYATPSCGDSGSDIGAPPASGEGGGGTAENSQARPPSPPVDPELGPETASSPNRRLLPAPVTLGSYRDLVKGGLRQAHHIIQDAAAQGIRGYSYGRAPAINLRGSFQELGTPHYRATLYQTRASGRGTYGAERIVAYRSLRAAGLTKAQARATVQYADEYFRQLGVTEQTRTRIPGTRGD